MILKGVTIGDNVIVGASVVANDASSLLQQLTIAIEEEITVDKLNDMKENFLDLKDELVENLKNKVVLLNKDLAIYKEKLNALNPKKVLQRGYSISMNESGQVIDSVNKINLGDKIVTVLGDGKVESRVTGKEEN